MNPEGPSEKEHAELQRAALEKIGKLRDRFTLSATALAVLGALMAVWVRAPTLEIELPLEEAKASLNVGYVLALGVPVIEIIYALAIGSLVSIRQYQFEIVKSLDSQKKALEPLLLLRLGGSHKERRYFQRLDWVASSLCKLALVFVLFLVPPLACGWISYDTLERLETFPAEPSSYDDVHCKADSPIIDCRHVLTFGEQLFGLRQAEAIRPTEPSTEEDKSKTTTYAMQFAVPNGDIEKACQRAWYHDSAQLEKAAALTEKLAAQKEKLAAQEDTFAAQKDGSPQRLAAATEREASAVAREAAAAQKEEIAASTVALYEPGEIKCVFNEFPRFIIPLTFWSNLLFTVITAMLSAFGLRNYWQLPKSGSK